MPTPADRRMLALQRAPLQDADAHAIERFLDALWAESGVARTTLASYRRDLEGFARWREGRGGGLAGADRAALFDYFAVRTRDRDEGVVVSRLPPGERPGEPRIDAVDARPALDRRAD